MFCGCEHLYTLNLTYMATPLLINMSNMFYNCKNLSSVDLSYFNTEKVVDMKNLFFNCYNLVSIIFNKETDASNVEDMSNMFYSF